MYKIEKNGQITRAIDMAIIPICTDNVEYQQYLQWVAQGNTAAPYVEPPVPIPQSLTPRQGSLMLSRAGLLDQVKSLLAGLEGQAGIEARIDFEMATEWKRDWPLLIAMSVSAGLTNEQVDQMFIDGAHL